MVDSVHFISSRRHHDTLPTETACPASALPRFGQYIERDTPLLLPILALSVQPTPLFSISSITDNRNVSYFRNR